MLSALLRLCFTSYLPGYLTPPLLRLLHSLLPLPLPPLPFPPFLAAPIVWLTSPPPRPGTPAYAQHYRIILFALSLFFVFVVPFLSDSSGSSEGQSYYKVLGVGPGADEGELKAAFRGWARRWHPDRPGNGAGANGGGEEMFRRGREGYEVLKDPVLRFAYDRFGPDALTWRHECATPKEYMKRGLLFASGYHVVTFAALVGFGMIGRGGGVVFWRYLLFFVVLAVELKLLVAPSSSFSSSSSTSLPSSSNSSYLPLSLNLGLWANRAPFEQIRILHRVFVAGALALARLVPQDTQMDKASGMVLGPGWERMVERIGIVGKACEGEVIQMLDTTLRTLRPVTTSPSSSSPSASAADVNSPSEPDKEVMDALTREMQNMIIERKLKQEGACAEGTGPLKASWEGAVRRRRRRAGTEANEKDGGMLPSPVSPRSSPPPSSSFGAMQKGGLGTGKLPSPRPSPEPNLRSSSGVRARSVSY